MQEYSPKIADAIETFLREDEWNFEPIDENGVIRFGVSLKCKFRRCDVRIRVFQNSFTVNTILPVSADEETRAEVLAFINRANYGFIHGNFEMDAEDGQICFRTSHYCGDEDIMISNEIVKKMLYVNVQMLERYGTAMMKVMMGTTSAADAIAEAEAD